MADPDWQIHAFKGVKGHMGDIKTGIATAET
jgi:hypothetical protein